MLQRQDDDDVLSIRQCN